MAQQQGGAFGHVKAASSADADDEIGCKGTRGLGTVGRAISRGTSGSTRLSTSTASPASCKPASICAKSFDAANRSSVQTNAR